MGFQLKYAGGFADLKHNYYHINVFKNSEYPQTVEYPIEFSGTPIVLDVPEREIYDPIISKGGVMEIMSRSDRHFIDLFTGDMREWKIEITYSTPGEQEVVFQGFLDPELYEQQFVRTYNYPVRILFNDGMQVLKREKYLDETGEKYVGVTSAFAVIKKCLVKTGLDFGTVYFLSDISINSFVYDNRIVLQTIIVQEENYIDEDNIPMSCWDVIDTILRPFSLTLMLIGADIWIVDREHGSFDNAELRQATWNPDPDTITLFSKSLVTKKTDLADIILRDTDAMFTIEASFNYYILNKNRYLHPIVEDINLDNLGEPTSIRRFDKKELTFYDGYWCDYSLYPEGSYFNNNFWIANYDDVTIESLNGWDLTGTTMLNRPYYTYLGSALYASLEHIRAAFIGGIKNVQYIGDTISDFIPLTEDRRDFEHFLFIQNPCYAFGPTRTEGWFPDFPWMEAANAYFKIGPFTIWKHWPYTDYLHDDYERVVDNLYPVATYTYAPAYLSSSETTMINFNFTTRIVHLNSLADFDNLALLWGATELTSYFSYWVLLARIYQYDIDGNIVRYLQLEGDTVTGSDDRHVDVSKGRPRYKWVSYAGTESDFQLACKLVLYDTDKYGNGLNIVNKNHTTNIYLPIDFVGLKQIKMEFLNVFYPVYNKAPFERQNATYTDKGQIDPVYYEDEYHLKAMPIYKQDAPLLGIKDIKMDIVDNITLEPIKDTDQELQYYVNENYKTESKNEELLHNTRDSVYINNVSGVMVSETSTLSNQLYITSGQANGVVKGNIEDLKGDKMIRHYEKNRIIISSSVYAENFMLSLLLETITFTQDSKWAGKKWLVRGLSAYNLRENSMQITLEEL